MTTNNQSLSSTTNIPLLPANTLTRPAPVDVTPTAPKMGDTITFTSKRGDIKQGIIESISWLAVTRVIKYLVKVGDFIYAVYPDQILPAKMPTAPVMDAAPVEETKDDILDTLRAINAASLAWQEAYLANPGSERTAKLSQAHDALYEAYMTSIGARVAPLSRKEGVSSASITTEVLQSSEPQEITVERVLEGSRKTGVVTYFNSLKGYGYIASGDDEYPFRRDDLKPLDMVIFAGEKVTFEPRESLSIERGGRTGATRVMVEGYTPAPRPVYQPSADLVADAKTADQPRKDARKAQRAFEQDRAARNASGFARMPRKNA